MSQKSICVFCGSSSAVEPHYVDLAERLGRTIAIAGYRLVYGGGGIGLMGATARTAHLYKGDVLGIIPEFLQTPEVVFKDVPHIVVPDMHTRKAKMYEEADAFVILPGGIGTIEEAVEVISWLRLNLHSKPVIFLDEDDYWAPMMELIHHTINAKFTPDWVSDHLFRAQHPITAINIASREMGRDVDRDLKRPIRVENM